MGAYLLNALPCEQSPIMEEIDIVGNYKVSQDLIGFPGIYRATNLKTNQDCAVKEILIDHMSKKEIDQRI